MKNARVQWWWRCSVWTNGAFCLALLLLLPTIAAEKSDERESATEKVNGAVDVRLLLLNDTDSPGFVIIETLDNDEKQIFTTNGSSWCQILTLSNSTDPGVSLIISGNDQCVVKSIYRDDGQLLDCDILVGEKSAKYLEAFRSEILRVLKQGNYEFHQLDEQNYTMSSTQLQALAVDEQRQRCVKLHETLLEANNRTLKRKRRVVNHDKAGNDHHHHIRHARRFRRHFYYGTLWCGSGHRAQSASQHGENEELDICCRKHDQCSVTIGPWTNRYHLFNHRPYAISSCDCDERFYDCLKRSSSDSAKTVGTLYFNIIGMPCFTLSLEYVCVEHSWLGKCKAKSMKRVAKLRSSTWF